jgi:hypothetical protein
MAGSAELPVGTCGGNLREQVFVEIAFGIAILHFDLIDLLHHHIQ